jgi:V/A-type H+-transporting ATPase subunit I
VVGTLARTGVVELELRFPHQDELRLPELEQGLVAYRALLPRYGRYWRRGRLSHGSAGDAPRLLLARALARLENWCSAADPLIGQLQAREDERHRLDLWDGLLQALRSSPLDLGLLGGAGPCLAQIAAILPETATDPALEDLTLTLTATLGQDHYLLAVGPVVEIARLEGRIAAAGGRPLPLPPWLSGTPAAVRVRLAARRAELDREIADGYRALDDLYRAHGLAEALGDISCLAWFTTQVGVLELASDRFALVTGWTAAPDPRVLTAALEREDAPALLHFPPPPPGLEPPQILDNPPWARPFELLTRVLGVPSHDEADPSPLLALIVPLLFGYMFGDLGQGLLLLAIGWRLRRRFALARLLIAGGASAALFGLVFGSVFGLEHLIPALWLPPLEQPLAVLALPLGLGVLLLVLGQLLNALQAAWRGVLAEWLGGDAGLLLAYLGIAVGLPLPGLRWLLPVGAAWYLLGAVRRGGSLGILVGLGELVERGLQLLVNTLSFARVGAFALAHAGLCAAVVALAAAAGGMAGALILVAGNVVVILLEGLVVSIQTTRLVLFEFFTRFLRGSGRALRPLLPPPTLVQGDNR